MRRLSLFCCIILTAAALLSAGSARAAFAELTSSPEDGAVIDPGDLVTFVFTVTDAWPEAAGVEEDGDEDASASIPIPIPCTVRAELGEGLTLDLDSVELKRTAQDDEDIGLAQFIFGNDGFVLLADRLDAGDRIVFAAEAGAGSGDCAVTYRDESVSVEYTVTVPPTEAPAPASLPEAEAQAAAPKLMEQDRGRHIFIWAGAGLLAAGCAAAAVLLIRHRIKTVKKRKAVPSALRAYIAALNMAAEQRFKDR